MLVALLFAYLFPAIEGAAFEGGMTLDASLDKRQRIVQRGDRAMLAAVAGPLGLTAAFVSIVFALRGC